MKGIWQATTIPAERYLYNGKELESGLGLEWLYYGARMHDPAIGRFTGVDPLADAAPNWTPYRYGFDNPLSFIDPDGLFETKADAKQYAKENNVKTGWFGNSRIVQQSDGTFAIVSISIVGGNIFQTFIQDFGGDVGVATGVIVRSTDEVGRKVGWFSDKVTLRDGSVIDEPHKELSLPAGGVVSGAVRTASMGGKYTFGQLRKALKAAYNKLGVKTLPKSKKGKFGSPQRGNPKKGVRLDKQGHPKSKDPNEAGAHINWWDYTKGKRGKGGNSGAIKIE